MSTTAVPSHTVSDTPAPLTTSTSPSTAASTSTAPVRADDAASVKSSHAAGAGGPETDSIASHHTTGTTHSIVSATKKMKAKIKNKLHRRHGDDDDDDAEEEEDDEEDDHDLTEAQKYAAATGTPSATNPTATDYASAGRTANGGTGAAATENNTSNAGLPRSASKSIDIDRQSIKSASPSVLPSLQSDWKRKAEFHNLFPGEISEDEELVSDYTSAWAKDILRHGRLYVGAKNLAFNCSILGLKAQLVIPYTDIKSIEKAVTARVIPNAITITTTSDESYLFSSFVYRDVSYDLICECWRAASPEGYENMVGGEVHEVEEAIEQGTPASPFPAEKAAPVTPRTPHAATECSGGHFKETALDVRFPSEPNKIFDLLFKDEEFHKKLCESQKLTDLKVKSWEPAGKADLEKRSFSYTKPLSGSVGPSSTTCYIDDEELVRDPEKAYEVLSITKTPDVPSGGSFEVQTKTCLTWAGGQKGGCRMLVTTECVWSGRSMIKGIVTSASIAGQRDYNKHLAKLVRAHIHAHPAEFGSSDVNAPEADDEVGMGDDDDKAELLDEASAAVGSRKGNDGFLGAITGPIKSSDIVIALLVLSNVLFLVLGLTALIAGRGPFGAKAGPRPIKSVMTPKQESEALARLNSLEDAWRGFQQCVDLWSPTR